MQEGHLRSPRGQFLGADLEGRAQLHVHGTHEVFFKLKKGLSIHLWEQNSSAISWKPSREAINSSALLCTPVAPLHSSG